MKPQRFQFFTIAAPQDEDNAQEGRMAARFKNFFGQLHDALHHSSTSFEMYASPQNIALGYAVPARSASVVTSLMYSGLPKADILECDDPLKDMTAGIPHRWAEVKFVYPSLIPLPCGNNEHNVPLNTLFNSLQRILPGEKAAIQMVISPIKDSFRAQYQRSFSRSSAAFSSLCEPRFWLNKENRKIRKKLSYEKSQKPLFSCTVRFLVSSTSKERSLEELLKHVGSSFDAFQDPILNRFSLHPQTATPKAMFERRNDESIIVTTEECASLFHIPSEQMVSSLYRVISHREPAPKLVTQIKAGEDVCWFGETNYRSQKIPFGIRRLDRRRHLYVLGKSGVGKSKLLELLIKSDIENGHGVCVLDPHGDLIDNILRMIPENRMRDVVLFDPADVKFPVAFNPLEVISPELKLRVTISLIDIFKKLFGNNWSPRLEHVLRYTTIALLDTPGTTVLSILKMLTDKKYRQTIVKGIKDDVVKNFWVNEFAGWSEKFDAEAITPLLNKVGQFVSTNMIRNIVGQPENKIHCRSIMDNQKILLVKIAKGLLGEENASLLGSMIITNLYQAAMSRADILEKDRKDFYLYVDEFQNFTTDTFDEILSEARKYRLNLTIANQFLGQLNERIKTTVFGNVGSIISLRVGGSDAEALSQEFLPRFAERDLINLGVQEFIIKMSVHGETIEAFSGKTLPMHYPQKDFVKECVTLSRQTYGRPLIDVEALLRDDAESSMADSSEGDSFEEPMI